MRRLDELLSDSVRLQPAKIALIDADRQIDVSYAELGQLSDGVMLALRSADVQAGDRVGICAPKSIASVASIFGAMKAGAAYVPVDSLAPASRNAFIFSDCSVRAILVDEDLVDPLQAALPGSHSVMPLPDDLNEYGVSMRLLVSEAEIRPAEIVDLAYILYTSGSTGAPKGVMHTHASGLSFVDWCSEMFDPADDDRFSSHAPFHFDLSILDLYVPIKHGASLVLIGEELGKQPLRLSRVIAEQRISMWYSTPSILRLLVEYGRMDDYDYSALRIVNFAGEVFPVKYLRELATIWPHPTYFNLYGPTETNVCTYYQVPDRIGDDRTEPFPIGQVCANDRCMVVEDDAPVEPGAEGELYVAGGSVMVGYWNLPERTDHVFYVDESGVRWYKTGDIVKQNDVGDYDFVGRRDRMVKRRGYRVELGEIESAFYKHPGVREAAVVALPDEESGVRIQVHLSWSGEKRPSLIRLKRFASENLPLYMIPDQFSFHDALPKTSTDKIDYQGLARLI